MKTQIKRNRGSVIGAVCGIIVAFLTVISYLLLIEGKLNLFLYMSTSLVLSCLLGWWIGGVVVRGRGRGKKGIVDEDILIQKDELYDSLFHANTDGIFVLDKKGNVVDCNLAMEKMSGYSREELQQMRLSDFVVPEDTQKKHEHCKRSVQGEPQEYEVEILTKEQERLNILIKMIPIIKCGQVVGVFEIFKDITQSKRLEALMRQTDKLSVVGQLAAGVAHEIRNPLTTLTGFLNIIQKDINSNYAKIMQSEIERINFIVGEFLVLSKPQEIEYSLNSVYNIIVDVTFMLEPQANLKNIQVKLSSDKYIPIIQCDENQLKQVFINLLKNAMDAMPNGGIIEVSLKVTDNQICIAVIDQGYGIPQDQLERLGEPFFTTKEEGTGLGIMVTRRIIENHGGKMSFESIVGKGTTVKIYLPIDLSK